MSDKGTFNDDLVKSYPKSSKKLSLEVSPYSLDVENNMNEEKGTTTYVSPYGLEFQAPTDYRDGTLLKINISIPNYWDRKQKFVEYGRIDTPQQIKVLAKVIRTQDSGKRGKKKLVLVQTVNIDEVDELVLKSYLQEGK